MGRSSWEDIFWKVDGILAKYPLLDHWRYAWNKIFSSDVLVVGGERRRYSKSVKHFIAGVIALLTIILSFAFSFMGLCCLSFSLIGTTFTYLVGIVFSLILSLIASSVAGPIFTGLMIFFYREEVNRTGEPSLALTFFSDPKYKKFAISTILAFWITELLSIALSYILYLPFALLKLYIGPLIWLVFSAVFLTLWYYISYFLVISIEEGLVAESSEDSSGYLEVKVAVEEETEESKEVEGVIFQMEVQDTSKGDYSIEDMMRESSIIADELKGIFRNALQSNIGPLKYALSNAYEHLKYSIRSDNRDSLIKVLLSSLMVSLSALLFVGPIALTFPFATLSAYRVIRVLQLRKLREGA